MKITILRGLPGSGKSTLAKKIIEEQPDTVRVNKDTLRKMLYFHEKGDRNHRMGMEKTIVHLEDELILSLLNRKFNVIVDDTNFNMKHENRFREMAKVGNHEVEVIMVDVPVDVCINRDSKRPDGERVGANVIKMMARQAGILKIESKNKRVDIQGPYVVCDMDGTLADCRHRLHHLTGEKKNWPAFFDGMSKDTLRKDVLKIAEDTGLPIVVVSARPESYREVTEDWLKRNGVDYHSLIMRKEGDYRPDDIVKLEILDAYLDAFCIDTVIDDRPSVIRAWKSRGLNVIDVSFRKGEEF